MARHSIHVLLPALTLTTTAAAALVKRAPAPPVEMTRGGVTYRPSYERELDASPPHFSARLEARDAASGRPRWSVLLYQFQYKPNLERDVQELFVKRLLAEEVGILAVREDLRCFLLKAGGGAVVALPPAAPPLTEQALGRGPLVQPARPGPSKCSVHGAKLKLDVVAMEFGLPRLEPAEVLQVRQRRFPNATVSFAAGCIVGSARWAEVRYCPDCREERERYLRPAKR